MTVALVCVTGLAHAADWKIEATPDRLDGVYRKGETVTFVARLLRDGYPPLSEEGYRIFLAVSMNGRPVTNGTANASGDVKLSFVAPREGWASCFAQARTPDNKELLRTSEEEPNKWRRPVKQQCGAMVDPEACRQGAPEPDDFDAYWAAERKAVLASPANAKLVKNPDPALAGRNDCFVFSADLPGEFAGPTAQVQIPQDKSRKYPIHISVHGTGVHAPRPGTTGGGPMPLAFRETLSGPVIGCNLNAHGYRLGEPEAFYRDLDAGALKDYQFQRSASDRTWYMKGLALRLIRTIDELCKLPEWDGRNVIVSGGSQGGAQALIAGGLDRRVNFVAADVPAMCDFGGELAGHAAGWPRPYHVADGRFVRSIQFADQVKTAVPDDESCVRRFGYMDAVNFAARINPDAVVAITTGGYDGVCPPTGVFAAYWRCPAKTKRMAFAPLGGHCQGDYLEGRNQVPAEWNGTARIDTSGFDPVETTKDGVTVLRVYAHNTYDGPGRNRSAKHLRVEKDGSRTLTFTGTTVEFVSNGRSWDAAEAELFLDGEQAGSALKAKKYRHQKDGVRTVIVDGCPAGRHELKISPKAMWVWANLGIGEIAVRR